MNLKNGNNNNFNFNIIKNLYIDIIISMSIFPSGNLISISKDKSIKIWDIELNLLQRIQEENLISDINIKDENNFIICTLCFIKIYFRNNNKFEIKDIIKNIVNSNFIKVKYFPEEKIFSSSIDNKIIIWEKTNNKYQNITTMNFSEYISFLLLEDIQILISSGYEKSIFWNIKTFEILFSIENFNPNYFYYYHNTICRIDKNKIIIVKGNDNIMKVISIPKKKIIKEIDNQFGCYGIYFIKDKSIFLTYGDSDIIKIYRNDNYKLIYMFEYKFEHFIKGFIKMKDNLILSYLDNGEILFWEIND